MAQRPRKYSIQSQIKELRNSENQPPDFVIRCKDQDFPAHKFLLALRSGYFKRLLNSSGSFTENSENLLKLEDEQYEPQTLKALLDIIYTDDYEYQDDWKYHMNISTLADYFEIFGVDDLIVTKIFSQPSASTLIYTKTNGQQCFRLDQDFTKGVETIFENACRLHSDRAKAMLAELLSDHFFLIDRNPQAAQWIGSRKGLLLEMLRVRERSKRTRVLCPNCRVVGYFEGGKGEIPDLNPSRTRDKNVAMNPNQYEDKHTKKCVKCGVTTPTLRWLDSWLCRSKS